MLRVLVTWSAVASAKCIYDTLPPSVNLTLVWNFSYCKSSKSASCYVNRSCVEQQKPVKSFEAIGDFSDSPDTDGHMNGYDKVYDWSLFIAPPNMISYTLNGYPRIELSPTFKWPPRLANLSLTNIGSITWPNTSQLPRFVGLNIDSYGSPITSFPASVKSLNYQFQFDVHATQFTAIFDFPVRETSPFLHDNPIELLMEI
ncbi:unnamed protein product [Aphanomyces euteiches]